MCVKGEWGFLSYLTKLGPQKKYAKFVVVLGSFNVMQVHFGFTILLRGISKVWQIIVINVTKA